MEKKEMTESTAFLPESLIHHIQSFMNGKEACQTSLFSKSWYDAWLTRPELDLTILPDTGIRNHLEYVYKALQRYRDSNLRIDSFTLRIKGKPGSNVAPKVIKDALETGATHLDLNLPQHILFINLPLASQTLVSLSVQNCSIFVVHEDMFDLPNLEVLSLDSVVVNAAFFTEFSSKFPRLKSLTIDNCGSFSSWEIVSASVERVVYVPNSVWFRVKFDVPNIRGFTCITRGPRLFSLSVNASREWELALNITSDNRELIPDLRLLYITLVSGRFKGARISLALQITKTNVDRHEVVLESLRTNIQEALKPVVVESLRTNIQEACTHCSDVFFQMFKVGN